MDQTVDRQPQAPCAPSTACWRPCRSSRTRSSRFAGRSRRRTSSIATPTDNATIEKALETADVAVHRRRSRRPLRRRAEPQMGALRPFRPDPVRAARRVRQGTDRHRIGRALGPGAGPARLLLRAGADLRREAAASRTRKRMCGAAFPATWTSLGSPARRSASSASAIPASRWPRSARPSDEGHGLHPQPPRTRAPTSTSCSVPSAGDSIDP